MVLKILVYLQILGFPLNVHLFMFFFAMLDQMDQSWVHGIFFSCEHIDDVKELINFIQGKSCEHIVPMW
jgi:hypothetical protein